MFGAHDFRRIEGGCDEAIGFGGKIAGRRDTATDMTGANEGTNEELLIKLVLARDAVIDVESSTFDEDRSKAEI